MKLIDPPVSPYSSMSDLLAWMKTCQNNVAASPDSQEWARALIDVERWIEMAKRQPDDDK